MSSDGVGVNTAAIDPEDDRHELREMLLKCVKNADLAILWLPRLAEIKPEIVGPELVRLAREYCGAVADFSAEHPTAATAIARKMPDWPCLNGLHIAIQEDTKDALTALELGRDHVVASAIMPKVGKDGKRRKGIDLRKPANAQAAMIFDAMTESPCPKGSTRVGCFTTRRHLGSSWFSTRSSAL